MQPVGGFSFKTRSRPVRYPKALAIMLTLFALETVAVLPGYSQNCDELIVDSAGVFRGDLSRLQDTAQKLVNNGADVRIRTAESVAEFGNLDIYEKNLENRCSSWQDGNGYRKNNLLVLMIAKKERKTGLYYGSQWDSALGSQWIRIQRDHMNPSFKAGNFVGGFVNGLEEINRLVEAHLRPTTVPTQPTIVQPAPAPSAPTDFSGLWRVLGWLVGLGGLGILAVVAFRIYSAREKRRAAQQKARIAKQSVAKRINDLSQEIATLEAEIEGLSSKMAAEDVESLRAGLHEIVKLHAGAAGSFNDYEQSAGNPDQPNLSETEYANIEQAYLLSLQDLQQADQLKVSAVQTIKGLEKLANQIPKIIEQLGAGIPAAENKIHTVRQRGFKTEETDKLLAEASQAVAEAASALTGRQYRLANRFVLFGINKVAQALENAESLPRKKEEQATAANALAKRIEETKQVIDTTRVIFEQISEEYAAPTWQSVRGNGSEATKRVAAAVQALDAARKASSMEKQEWAKAGEFLQKANDWLDQAESMMRSITALEGHLAQAKKDAPQEIKAAQDDIAKAWKFIHLHDADVRDSLEDDLRSAEEDLAKASKELSVSKPDYFVVNDLAKEANAAADKILNEARGEYETAERLRQKAAGALRDAAGQVSKAKEYIEDHSGDVSRSAKDHLKDAQTKLKDAKAATHLETRITLAEEAEKKAKKAYSKAEGDVSESDDSYTPEGCHSTSFPSFGGGGSSWGGSGGGGGSSSFGGGGGSGGGGSTGW